MTKIRKVPVTQYYLKLVKRDPVTGQERKGYKRRYKRYVYAVTFPKAFNVEDLAGRELEFRRRGTEITIRPAETPKPRKFSLNS